MLLKGPWRVSRHVDGCELPAGSHFCSKYQWIRDGPSKTHGKMINLGNFLHLAWERWWFMRDMPSEAPWLEPIICLSTLLVVQVYLAPNPELYCQDPQADSDVRYSPVNGKHWLAVQHTAPVGALGLGNIPVWRIILAQRGPNWSKPMVPDTNVQWTKQKM